MIVIRAIFPYNPIQMKMYECLESSGKTVGPKAALIHKPPPRVNREAGVIPARSRHCKQG
ncbi:hypothetical protein YSY43_02730 [Paenibacillus sp. YSY-4.3]